MKARRDACPHCQRPVTPRGENPAWPFCSDRCRLVDLSRWLGEEYRIPGPRGVDGSEPHPDAEEDPT